MVVDDVQFMNTFKGKRIKLTLQTSSYFGVVQRINPNKTLVLADGRIKLHCVFLVRPHAKNIVDKLIVAAS